MWRDCWIVLLSRLARALWIEIKAGIVMPDGTTTSRLARALWIEMPALHVTYGYMLSRLARALWIEIGNFVKI